MKHTVSLTIALTLVWITLSGHFETLLLVLGGLSIAFVVWMGRRMAVVDSESHPLHLSKDLLTYWPWLVLEIVKSSLDLTRRALGPARLVAPRIVRVPARQRSDVGRVIHANSITLTPGTVSLHVGAEDIEVHAIAPEVADELVGGAMDRRVPDAGEAG